MEDVMNEHPTSRATIAGILDIAAGLMALTGGAVMGLLAVIGTGFLANIPEDGPPVQYLPLAVFGPLALMLLGSAVVAVAGGIVALKRSSWGWSLAGAVAAILAFVPLGVVALILTIMAEHEFRRQEPGAAQTVQPQV